MKSIQWIAVAFRGISRWIESNADRLWRYLQGAREPRLPTQLKGMLAEHGDMLAHDDVLSSMVDHVGIDERSFDVYLTLGAAFRRNGEYSRAVALHEHMSSATQLGTAHRHTATLALATDYAVAGMLDRAESLLSALLTENPGHGETRAQLLRLYEKQQDWQQAIECAASGTAPLSLPANELIAQYCCELAVARRQQDELQEAKGWLDEALKKEPNCGRALLMLCESAIAAGNSDQTLKLFERIEKHHPELAPEIAAAVFYLLRESGDDALLAKHLDYVRRRQNSYTVIKLAREAIAEQDGESAAERFFLEQVARRPSLKALYDWAERELTVTKSREKDKIAAIVQMLRGVVDDKAVYSCEQCGYRCNEMQWRCPGCESWKSVKVIIGVEGE
jgi:lipopolysaccharide biosynthesis regulator YciM